MSAAPSNRTINFYAAARGYLHAAQIIASHSEFPLRQASLTLPTSLLIAFAVELFLKCLLASQGVGDKVLWDIGHSLKAAYQSAIDLGYKPPDDLLDQLIAFIHDDHLHNRYRYMPQNTIFQIPRIDQATALLVRLDDQIRELTGITNELGPSLLRYPHV